MFLSCDRLRSYSPLNNEPHFPLKQIDVLSLSILLYCGDPWRVTNEDVDRKLQQKPNFVSNQLSPILRILGLFRKIPPLLRLQFLTCKRGISVRKKQRSVLIYETSPRANIKARGVCRVFLLLFLLIVVHGQRSRIFNLWFRIYTVQPVLEGMSNGSVAHSRQCQQDISLPAINSSTRNRITQQQAITFGCWLS